MAFYSTMIEHLEYDKEHKTFYTTQGKMHQIGILFGLKPSDTILIKGKTMNLEFQYSHNHGSVMVFHPIIEDYHYYTLVIDK